MQSENDQLDLAAVRRAAQDLVSLQRGTEQNLQSGPSSRERSDRQTDLSEGTSRVADSLFTLGRQTPFITPRLAESLGRAMQQLSESGRELATGNRGRGEEAGRGAARALNEAVLELRQVEESMCQAQGGGMPGQTGQGKLPSAQRVSELGERQNRLNQQSRGVAQRLTEQIRLSAGDRGELERLAAEQQRIREQLEQVQRDEREERDLLGRLDQTQREMREVEEALREGRADGDLEAKQQRILSRMLDAQRSINRRDFDPERESRPGDTQARVAPSELPSELLRESDRLRLGLLKAEADRYPAQYRSLIESYLRSLHGSRR
jgi:hypothetical protein